MPDRISNLPDSVLCHILSFLPTKHAVATSILSKRWRPLWPSVPTLDFDDESYVKNETQYFRFVQFVYTVLVLRDVQSIKRFRLKCVSCRDASNIDIWVKAAIHHKVEQLEIFLSKGISLSSSIFARRTIVVLKLNGPTLNAFSSVSLPSLKILHLENVEFPDKEFFAKVIVGCTILEDSVIKSLRLAKMKLLQWGILNSLPKLFRAEVPLPLIPLRELTNVEFLRIIPCYCHFSLDTSTFHNLVHLDVTFYGYYWQFVEKMLQNSPKLQTLVLHNQKQFHGIQYGNNWHNPALIPVCLSTHLRKCCLRGFDGPDSEMQFARYIMENARVLQTMTICSTIYSNSDEKLQMIKRLSSCRRSSAACELWFE